MIVLFRTKKRKKEDEEEEKESPRKEQKQDKDRFTEQPSIDLSDWTCKVCTLVNDSRDEECQVCQTPKDGETGTILSTQSFSADLF